MSHSDTARDTSITPGSSTSGSAPVNAAAWITAKRAPFAVGPAPYTAPKEREIVVRNGAVAINPIDWIIQTGAYGRWIKYPFVLGTDVAGEVVEVGSAVTRFKVGDRVLAHALGSQQERNTATEGAFQHYTLASEHMASPIPAGLTYEHAAVLPLGLSTAASALYQADFLGLRAPSLTPEPTGETLLVWGGSTSVGCNAIQLAVAAGYEVLTTCSPANFDLVQGLGAAQAFDYRSQTVVADIGNALKGRRMAGALAIGTGSTGPCVELIGSAEGKRFVAVASTPVSFQNGASPSVIARLILAMVGQTLTARRKGVAAKFINGGSLAQNEVSRIVYADFLPQALADGAYTAAPEPLVIGTGLASIQAGLDASRKGVSARKVVVTL